MNGYLSDKIRNLSALAILMVLYIHMYYREGETMPTLLAIERFIGSGMCSVAVPLFYMISGYLFFFKVPYGLKSIFGKIRKRIRTLLVPYIIANILTFLFYVTLNLIALKITAIDNLVNFKVLKVVLEDGICDTLRLIFISPPIAFQLWFIRDLLIVIAFSPIIWFALKKVSYSSFSKWLMTLLLLSVFIFYGENDYIAAFVWFIGGGSIAVYRVSIDRVLDNYKWLSLVLLFGYLSVPLLCGFNLISVHAYRYIPLVGIPALWYIYDTMWSCTSFQTILSVRYTFFVYLIHEPLLNIFKKLPLLIGQSESIFIISYLTIPLLFYYTASSLGYVLKRIIPKTYSIYTGGR